MWCCCQFSGEQQAGVGNFPLGPLGAPRETFPLPCVSMSLLSERCANIVGVDEFDANDAQVNGIGARTVVHVTHIHDVDTSVIMRDVHGCDIDTGAVIRINRVHSVYASPVTRVVTLLLLLQTASLDTCEFFLSHPPQREPGVCGMTLPLFYFFNAVG